MRDSAASLAILLVATFVLAAMMVSNVRYYSFKELDLRDKVPFIAVLFIVLAFFLISLEPAGVLSLLFVSYALSGPIVTLFQIRKRREARREQKRSHQDAA